MSTFADSKQLLKVMTMLWEQIKADPSISTQLIDSKLIVQFQYQEPNGFLTIDCSDGHELKIIVGQTSIKPVIEMIMKAELAHEFWMGKVNIPLAILTGKVVSKGPTSKAIALLPVIRPAFAIYPKVFQEASEETFITK